MASSFKILTTYIITRYMGSKGKLGEADLKFSLIILLRAAWLIMANCGRLK